MSRISCLVSVLLTLFSPLLACSKVEAPTAPAEIRPGEPSVGAEPALKVGPGFDSDACQILPGAEVVQLVGGRLTEERLIKDQETVVTRCLYLISDDAGGKAFVFWLMPAEDYTGMKEFMDDPYREVAGLGDEAFITYHPDDDRYDLIALKRDRATIEVTGPNEEDVRTLVSAALKAFDR
ncbi:MAG: hypothetical protein JSU96_03430 [Acidobacteriota bacterium]|nr:MAG: hypothetical protein JSU96_03430 [Acidobacteriota bacterium]